MAEYVQPTYRAFMIPSHRVTEDSLQSTGTQTQAGPQPGFAVAQRDTEMALKTSGSQPVDDELRIRTVRSGHPGRSDGRFAWKQEGDADFRGWDLPMSATGWEAVDYTTVLNANQHPHIITLQDDQMLIAYAESIVGAPAQEHVRVRRRSIAGVWGAEVAVYNEDTNGQLLFPTIVELPDKRILLFHWTLLSTTLAQVRAHVSLDKGDTWEEVASDALPLPELFTTLFRLRAAFANEQILLIGHTQFSGRTRDDAIIQWASDSLGATFSQVHEDTGANTANSNGFPDIAVVGGTFVVLYVPQDDVLPSVRRLGSAFESFGNATEIQVALTGSALVSASISGTAFSGGDQAICTDDDGTLYVYNRGGGVIAGNGKVFRSVDDGATWLEATESDTPLLDTHWFSMGGATPLNFSACSLRGRVLLAHNWAATTGNEQDSLGILYLGGYTTVVLPRFSGENSDKLHCWGVTWAPLDLPGDSSDWTRVETDGTGVEVLAAPGILDLHTEALKKRDYFSTATTTLPADGAEMMAIWSVSVGQQSVSIHTDAGSGTDFHIEVRMTTTTLLLFDVNAGATVGSSVAVSSNTKHQILVSSQGSNATLWFRVFTTDEDRAWTRVATTSGLTDGGGGTGAQTFRFGAINTGASEGEWVLTTYLEGSLLSLGGINTALASDQTNPDDLIGRQFNALPVYVDNGVKVSAVDGPSLGSDTWNIDTRFDFPFFNTIPLSSPSPNALWRSTSTAAQNIEYELDPFAGSDFPSDLFGLWFDNVNITGIQLSAKTSPGGGFATIFDATFVITVDYTRNGKSIEITANAGDEFYIEADEFRGQNFAFDATDARLITRNTGGMVATDSAVTNVRPTLYCDDIDDTEPASGTGFLYPKRALVVVNLAGATWSDIRIRVTTIAGIAAPSEGFWFAGLIAVGAVHVLGQDNSQTRRITRTPNVSLQTAPDGRRKSRRRGPARQTYALDWTEGVETTPIFDQSANFIVASDNPGAEAVAMRFDAPLALRGMQRWTDGPDIPCVYIPSLPHLTVANNLFVKQRARGCRWVRFTSPLQLDTQLGTEEVSELIRASAAFGEEV